MPIITLTTDFGFRDTFAGVMKGVILSIAPAAQIVDLCHGIPPQDILAGALALEESAAFFPRGTIHVAVVDPGVGSDREAIAVETERAFYIGPDNGLFDLVVKKERLKRAVKLQNPRYRLPAVSATFHGRDIFAPAAAHLANGVALDEFGAPIAPLTELAIPMPTERLDGLKIHVLRVDNFGNLITDLTRAQFSFWNTENSRVRLTIGQASFLGVNTTYSEVPEGSPAAYFGSGGRLEIAVRNGDAAAYFQIAVGFSIQIAKL